MFFSYSHFDKAFARRLAQDVKACGHRVWIDEGQIYIGDSLVKKIGEALKTVDYVMAILSSRSVQSEWVQKELEIAINREINGRDVVVLPVLIEDVEMPIFLNGKLYADFRNAEGYPDELKKLLASMKRAPKINSAPTIEEDEQTEVPEKIQRICLPGLAPAAGLCRRVVGDCGELY
ncbi:MAG TPA: toll/interleukin-1 receptor domain-containing protein [Thermoanaerobaculia bacterium]|nr:toll/interleukin-1 receptor domain-containing protein [Thermoanaerobaculia bacterium]